MYTEEWLSKIPFFRELLKTEKINDVVDSLTGLIARPQMLAFMQSLIQEGTPFTFGILDLDNFKTINDTFGHKTGDVVLSEVAKNLIDFLGEDGLAGRFGGDEFLIIHLKIRSYAEKKEFCDQLFRGSAVLNRCVSYGDNLPFITGTLGCVTFPDDALDYEKMFSLADKVLYRGKTKGRNCYVIYVESKHKDIEIKNLASHTLYSTFRAMAVEFDSTPDFYEKMRRIYKVLKDTLWITDFYYVNSEREMKSVVDGRKLGDVPDIDLLVRDEVYSTNDLDVISEDYPHITKVLKKHEIETFVVCRIGMGPLTFGYIMCAEPRSRRIWQDDEFAILFSLSRMLAGVIRGAGLKLE